MISAAEPPRTRREEADEPGRIDGLRKAVNRVQDRPPGQNVPKIESPNASAISTEFQTRSMFFFS